MKHFNEYLTEAKKTYNFKLRAAGELPPKFENNLELALNKYEIIKCQKVKTTPITETPLDFPRLSNMEVSHFDVELGYPTTTHVLANYLTAELSFPDTHLSIRNENDPMDEYIKQDESEPYEPLITNPELGGESCQDKVGDNRVMDLLKELEVARKERAVNFSTGESN